MASAVTTDKITSTMKVLHFDFDPDGSDAVDVSWQDMRDFAAILVSFFRTVGTGDLDAFKILGNSASDGSGTDAEIKDHALGSQPDAVGDYIFLSALASEFSALGTDLRYVSANLEFATSTDEGVVTYILTQPKFQYQDLTADTIA